MRFVEDENHKSKPVYEPCKNLKLIDTSGVNIQLWVPVSILPENICEGDVIRVKSVVSSVLTDFRHILVPTDHSNIMHIRKHFKIYKSFTNKVVVSDG